eukprot:5733507-Pyramimonas_sp.AAC.1
MEGAREVAAARAPAARPRTLGAHLADLGQKLTGATTRFAVSSTGSLSTRSAARCALPPGRSRSWAQGRPINQPTAVAETQCSIAKAPRRMNCARVSVSAGACVSPAPSSTTGPSAPGLSASAR